MKASKRLACLAFLLAAGLSIGGCGGGSTQPSGDFSIAVSPGTVNLAQGAQSSPVTVSVTAVNGFSGSVTVTITGLPAGVTSSPASPFTVAAGASTSVTFSATGSATLGPANLNFQGTSGSLNHTASASLTVAAAPDFGITVTPASVSLTQGATSAPVTVVVTAENNFTGNVTVSISNLPTGVTMTPASPFSVTPGATGVSVTFTASSTAAPGTVSLSFQGVSGSLNHSASASLQIQAALSPDFTVQVSPGTVALSQGTSSNPVTISVAGINGFTGTVNVTISGLPAGVTASVPSLQIPAGGSGQVVFSAPINATPTSAVLTVTGSNGSLSHSQPLTLQVLAGAVFSTTYFQFAGESGIQDETVNIVNPGIQSTPSTLGTLCANIYVFDQSQELKECCSCPITANGNIALSVNDNLISNSGNGVAFSSGSIDVVPGTVPSEGFCDPTVVVPAPDLDVWATHIGFGPTVVEFEAADLSLSGTELTDLVSTCTFLASNQSGAGICSCASENGGASPGVAAKK